MFQLSLRATEGSVAISATCHFETVPNCKRLEIIQKVCKMNRPFFLKKT